MPERYAKFSVSGAQLYCESVLRTQTDPQCTSPSMDTYYLQKKTFANPCSVQF